MINGPLQVLRENSTMSLAISAFAPEPLFTRRAYRKNMARAAKAFSAISLGAAFVLTTGEAGAQSSRASAEEGFSPLNGTPNGFNDDGDLIVLMADGSEAIIPRGEYGLIGDQIMVSDMIEGVEVAQNGYIPPTSGAPMYGSYGPSGMGYATWLIPLGLVAAGVLAYIYFSRSVNEAPTLGAASYSDTIAEGASTSTVLFTASATDGESDAIVFSLSGNDASSFSIDPTSGAVTFKAVPDFEPAGDADGNNIYSFNVVATDEHGEAALVPATVTLTDTSDALAAGVAPATAGVQDISYAVAPTVAVNTGPGNDDILLSAGIGAGGSVDAGSGAAVVRIEGTATPAGAAVDMGSGADLLQLKATMVADLAIDLGAADAAADILELTAPQTQVHVVSNFNATAEDKIDVSAFNLSGSLNTTDQGNAATAQAAISTTHSITYETGTDRVYIDSNNNGTWDVGVDTIIDLGTITTLDATDFIL